MKWIDTLAWKIKRYTIRNLMNYIVIGMAIVFGLDMALSNVSLYNLLSLNMAKVGQGEVWRLITFIFLPPNSSPIWIIFSLYFYWMIGSALQNQWGTAKFNLYYLIGIVGNILAALITGYGTNQFLNLSLFFAFAASYPDYEMMIFFILPVKMKWLAILNAILFVWQLITGTWSVRAAIIMSIINVILFLGGDMLSRIKDDSQYWKTRRNFRKAMRK